MDNNDILRRLRYAFHYTDSQMAAILGLVGAEVKPEQVAHWLKREEDTGFVVLSDADLCCFLDGLIIEKRGPGPAGIVPEVQKSLSRNEVLKKLRIALALRDDGMLDVFKKADFVVTKSELGSFFRKPSQRNYAKCPEQVLRKFLQGLSQQNRE